LTGNFRRSAFDLITALMVVYAQHESESGLLYAEPQFFQNRRPVSTRYAGGCDLVGRPDHSSICNFKINDNV